MKKNLGVEIWGQKWSKKGSFRIFSKSSHEILLMFGQERALIVLQVCAKCGVREKSGSLDFGQKVVKMARNGGGGGVY